MTDGNDRLEKNIERLLSRTPPGATMPAGARERALEALLAEAADHRSATSDRDTTAVSPMRRRITWLTAAAAAIILAVVILWPTGLDGGLTWADVRQHLDSVETVIADITFQQPATDGTRRSAFARLYQKDPGRSRTELYATPGGEVESITIAISTPRDATLTLLQPREKMAMVRRFHFSGDALDSRAGNRRDLVAGSWERLKEITSDQARRVGERDVDGVWAVGFEADIADVLPGAPQAEMQGTARVWAAADSGAPVRIELDFDRHGERWVTRMEHLQWNAPLSPELFVVPDLDGWEVDEEEIHNLETSPKPPH